MRRVARGPVVIVTYDPQISGRMWLMADYLPEVGELDRRIFPAPELVAEWLGGRTHVEELPIPADTEDWTLGSFWAHPERVLDEEARNATSGFARMPDAVVERVVAAVAADLSGRHLGGPPRAPARARGVRRGDASGRGSAWVCQPLRGGGGVSHEDQIRVAVVGGGLGGLSAALFLRRAGIGDVTVFEQTRGSPRSARASRWRPTPSGCCAASAWPTAWRRWASGWRSAGSSAAGAMAACCSSRSSGSAPPGSSARPTTSRTAPTCSTSCASGARGLGQAGPPAGGRGGPRRRGRPPFRGRSQRALRRGHRRRRHPLGGARRDPALRAARLLGPERLPLPGARRAGARARLAARVRPVAGPRPPPRPLPDLRPAARSTWSPRDRPGTGARSPGPRRAASRTSPPSSPGGPSPWSNS